MSSTKASAEPVAHFDTATSRLLEGVTQRYDLTGGEFVDKLVIENNSA